MKPAIFLDRDGVIVENIDNNYVNAITDVSFIPGALEALRCLAQSEFAVILVTNQAGVAKGYLSLETAHEINDYILQAIQHAGGRVDQAYMCHHAPEANCICRKPKPGMLLQAARELDLDLSQSWMIGDALTDLQAGQAAGVKETVLVLTGRGQKQAAQHQLVGVADLTTALKKILGAST